MGTGVEGDVYIGCAEARAFHLLAEAAAALGRECPGIRFHLYSGNAEEVDERLDKGLLDFGLLIEPYDLSRYESLPLPEKERWWVLMRKDSPLAKLEAVRKEDLLDKPLIVSRQAMEAGPCASAPWSQSWRRACAWCGKGIRCSRKRRRCFWIS